MFVHFPTHLFPMYIYFLKVYINEKNEFWATTPNRVGLCWTQSMRSYNDLDVCPNKATYSETRRLKPYIRDENQSIKTLFIIPYLHCEGEFYKCSI